MSRFTTTCLLFAASFALAASACDAVDPGGDGEVDQNFTPPPDPYPQPEDASAAPDELGCNGDEDCTDDQFCSFALTCGGPGVCTSRPDFCFRILDPVCGCDGQTYDNACNAQAAGVSVASAGECPGECVCTLEYEPVCGVDGMTYGNACAAGCADVEVDHDGECERLG